MSAVDASENSVFSIPGAAADHLYREGSAKASFWEALFGSSLSGRRRTHVSVRGDGARIFDVPTTPIESRLLDDAAVWLEQPRDGVEATAALAGIRGGSTRVKLIGVQPQGRGVADFSLRFETAAAPNAAVGPALAAWFVSEGPRLTRDILIPFGFTPEGMTAKGLP